MSDFMSLQATAVDFFNPDAPSFLDYAVGAISLLGNWKFLAVASFLVLLKKKQLGKKMLLVLAITLLAVYPLKQLTHEARPYATHANIRAVGGYESTGSFPSAHAALAFAYFMLLSGEFNRKKLFLIAIAVSLSRLYLGQHYPLDIAAGALLGSFIGYAVRYKYPVEYHPDKEAQND